MDYGPRNAVEIGIICPHCRATFLAKAIKAHVCRKAPALPEAPLIDGKRRLTQAEIKSAGTRKLAGKGDC